ncbi:MULTISPECIES: fumarylacetoacetate hydrolase family protein [unclassified Streptomyces]|uniref:fumarylacetoacetate hydrolase family protein n=1 Tax=unclassified Streptomyces TaxID=2593676 RepID=UPI0006F472F1|nr:MULTISPECIES: fumarylacetoacetate hydrolase family protein [unclassified Streptomyces]KQX50047.1 2-hydroxyhepta-2,4-diene-1,7-dioate isomerase [Streptomyces sp. Root1304]KRA79910.1 2-hydroxyhepta-2,4-diene-1,7-dioate isomerase [Streptomyces sp. Root66D1]
MRVLRVGEAGAERPAVLSGSGELLDASGVLDDIDHRSLADGALDRLARAVAAGELPVLAPGKLPGPAAGELSAPGAGADGIRIGAPVARPGKVVCIGLNYRDHAAETGAAIPAEPVVFMKDPWTVSGPYDDVLIPRGSVKTDYEVELAVVIGRTARYLETDEEALACVAGYAVSHDVSERAFQLERGGQWDKGKSCETFNPLGPWLVTPDEVPDPGKLALGLSVNGVERQNGTTADMVFPVAGIIRYLSRFMVLYPGDVINTGTPAGVALGRPEPRPYLRDGDSVECGIDGLGTMRHTFRQA